MRWGVKCDMPDSAPHSSLCPQLHTGDYLPYTDAATSNGFAFLEYDVASGGGLMEIATDAIEVSPVLAAPRCLNTRLQPQALFLSLLLRYNSFRTYWLGRES